VYASSSSAYEPHLNPYAASKCIVEYAADSHPNCLGLRLHTVYSDVPRKDMFFDKLLNGTLEYATNHYRDFIHLEDACTAIELLAISTNLKGVADVGTGSSIYIPSIAPNLNIKEYTPHERSRTQADTKILKELGFKPKYTVENFLTTHNKGVILQYITGENI
jgi:nucleoside-diphosphate-sugar epimerase